MSSLPSLNLIHSLTTQHKEASVRLGHFVLYLNRNQFRTQGLETEVILGLSGQSPIASSRMIRLIWKVEVIPPDKNTTIDLTKTPHNQDTLKTPHKDTNLIKTTF